jgi:hypothetical protein
MTAMWALGSETGLPVLLGKKRKKCEFAHIFFPARRFRFLSPSFFLYAYALFYGFALASTKALEKEKHGRPPLQIWPPLGIHFLLYESYTLRYLNTSTYLTVRYIDNLSSFGLA